MLLFYPVENEAFLEPHLAVNSYYNRTKQLYGVQISAPLIDRHSKGFIKPVPVKLLTFPIILTRRQPIPRFPKGEKIFGMLTLRLRPTPGYTSGAPTAIVPIVIQG